MKTQKLGGLSPRAWLFAALLVVTMAAAMGVTGNRSAQADVPQIAPSPANAPAAVQAASALLAAQAAGSPATGATFFQVLWGGTKGDPHGSVKNDANLDALRSSQNPARQRGKSHTAPTAKNIGETRQQK